jgi:hypothetical protein
MSTTDNNVQNPPHTGLLPEGIFRMRATDRWSLSETAKGTPYAQLTFTILEGPAKGRTISKDFYLSENAWKKSVEGLRACGWSGEDIGDLRGVERNEVVGKIVHEIITKKDGTILTDEAGNARYRVELAWVGEPRGPKATPMEATKLSSFRELMKARLQGMNTDAEPPASSDDPKDKIPF